MDPEARGMPQMPSAALARRELVITRPNAQFFTAENAGNAEDD
jgi:hypothetical protein